MWTDMTAKMQMLYMDIIEALSRADQLGDYDELYEVIYKLIIRSYVELCKQ